MDLNESNRAMLAPPSELAGSVPRKAALKSKSTLLFVLLIVIWGAAILAPVGGEAVQQTRQRATLHRNSREVVGQVMGFIIDRLSPIIVKYNFTVNGKPYFGEAEEPRSVGPWSGLKRSDTIPIRFFPPNPAINHPANWDWSVLIRRNEILFGIFLLTLAGIGLFYLTRERELAREGKAVAGSVTSCTPDGQRFRVGYEFCTEEGVSLKGISGRGDSYEPGGRIWILYLRQNPKRNHPYPLDDYVVIG